MHSVMCRHPFCESKTCVVSGRAVFQFRGVEWRMNSVAAESQPTQ